jgi:hypothetical protein
VPLSSSRGRGAIGGTPAAMEGEEWYAAKLHCWRQSTWFQHWEVV